jgi:hypothetical protein
MATLRRIVEELRLLVYNHGEKYLDVTALLAHQQKLREAGAGTAGATTTANVGSFMVPLGRKVRRRKMVGRDRVEGKDPIGSRKVSRLKLPPGYRIERVLTGFAYARNGNTHNPTPRYIWETFFEEEVLGTSYSEKSAVALIDIHKASVLRT